MNSCAYPAVLEHDRPGKNRFRYSIYLMYIDLDELNGLEDKLWLFSYNRWNLLSFYDDDHFLFVRQKGKADRIARETFDYTREKYIGKDTKGRVAEALNELGLSFELGRVCILTNLRNLGYIFNPVSFYYCYDKEGKLRALLSEVNNTFREQKLYHAKLDGKREHRDRQKKNFYISPFIDTDSEITWRFREPGESLFMQVNSVKGKKPILKAIISGKRRELGNWRLMALFLRYPMMPLMAITFRNKDKSDDEIIRAIQ
jgi:uncharacterized protein